MLQLPSKYSSLLLIAGLGLVFAGGWLYLRKSRSLTDIPAETETETENQEQLAPKLAYQQQMNQLLAQHLQVLQEINLQIQEPGQVFSDLTVQEQLAQKALLVTAFYDQVNSISPPENYVNYHQEVVEGMRLQKQAADDLANGIKQRDANLIRLAAGQITQGSNILEEASLLLPKE